jgi:predicted nucleic acid-binding protein
MTLPWAYFDTSVLAKRYLTEPGSFQARVLIRKYRCVTSVLTPVELFSAFVRRRLSGELNDRAFAAVKSRANRDRERGEFVAVNESLLRQAEQVIRVRGIKALDAVHIASALTFRDDSGAHTSFISADEKQLDAAIASGMQVERV